MLYLQKPSSKDLDEYYETFRDNIIKARNDAGLDDAALSPCKIKMILTDEPDKLMAHHWDFMPFVIAGFSEADYQSYFELKKLKEAQRTDEENTLVANYKKGIETALGIFDYDTFLSAQKPRSYDLALKLKRNTCTYCNRLYTNTVTHKDEETNRVNNDTRITRAQFDHWYARSRYPVLGLSFYNLIPSCSVCNSSVKGDEPFALDTHIHPYVYEAGQHFKFSFYIKDTDQPNVKLIPTGNKMTKHLDEFKIKHVYDAHSNFELKDLLDLKYKYSENYLNTLFDESFKTLNVDKEDIYRMIFGVEYREDDFHKRTFSKFKKDILNELGIIA